MGSTPRACMHAYRVHGNGAKGSLRVADLQLPPLMHLCLQTHNLILGILILAKTNYVTAFSADANNNYNKPYSIRL